MGGGARGGEAGYGLHGAHCAILSPRTLTQEDPGDNQITLEEIMQMVSRAAAGRAIPSRTGSPGRLEQSAAD